MCTKEVISNEHFPGAEEKRENTLQLLWKRISLWLVDLTQTS